MRRWNPRLVGVVAAAVIGAMFLFASPAMAFTLNWVAPTQYTDGTPIESSKTITYDVAVDGSPQAANISGTSWPIPQSLIGHGKTLAFTLKSKLNTGEESAWSPPFPWTSPLGNPNPPSGISVTP